MRFTSKVAQEIEGNMWFEKNIKKLHNTTTLTETQIKTIIADAIAYYLIDAISFRMFIETVDQVGERSEIQTMPEIQKTTNHFLSLSKYSLNPETHRKDIIDIFNCIVLN